MQHKLRILMVAPEPVFEPRGTPFSVLYRTKALCASGHTVDLATYHLGEDVPIQGLTYKRIVRVPFIKKVKVGPSITKIFLDVFLLWKTFFLLLRNRYDAIHTHEEAAFWGVILARLFRLPHVYDMHSSLVQQLGNFSFLNYRPFRALLRALEKMVLRQSAAVITICRDLYDLVRRDHPQTPVANIENVLDNEYLFGRDDSLFQQYKERLAAYRVVLYYGTFEVYQGIDLLIGAANEILPRHKDVVFLLIGGKAEQIARFKGKACPERLWFMGTVHPRRLPAFVERADILATTRIRGTNTPLKVYSYLRAGKPIVATDIYSHTQVFSPDTACLVNTDAYAIAAGIEKVLTDPAYAAAIAGQAAALARKSFSPESYQAKVDALYQPLVLQPARSKQ